MTKLFCDKILFAVGYLRWIIYALLRLLSFQSPNLMLKCKESIGISLYYKRHVRPMRDKDILAFDYPALYTYPSSLRYFNSR